MNQVAFQHTLSRALAIGAAGVTIFLITGNVTDPVNAPKLFLLGGFGGAALSLTSYLLIKKAFRFTGLEVLVVALVLWSIMAVFMSSSPFPKGFMACTDETLASLPIFS